MARAEGTTLISGARGFFPLPASSSITAHQLTPVPSIQNKVLHQMQHAREFEAANGALPFRKSQMLPIRVIGDVVLKDRQLEGYVGVGGALRFFLLGKQIKHSFLITDDETWQSEKESIAHTANLPFAELPLLFHNGVAFYGSAAILRYLTKKMGEYGSDVRRDFIADVVTDKLSPWRTALDAAIDALLSSKMESGFYTYIAMRLSFFDEFEKLLAFYTDSLESPEACFFTGANAVMCDYVLFSILHDDIRLMKAVETDSNNPDQTENLLQERPRLRNLYGKLASLPQISETLTGKGSNEEEEVPAEEGGNAGASLKGQSLGIGDGSARASMLMTASYEPPMVASGPQMASMLMAAAGGPGMCGGPSSIPSHHHMHHPAMSGFGLHHHPEGFSSSFSYTPPPVHGGPSGGMAARSSMLSMADLMLAKQQQQQPMMMTTFHPSRGMPAGGSSAGGGAGGAFYPPGSGPYPSSIIQQFHSQPSAVMQNFAAATGLPGGGSLLTKPGGGVASFIPPPSALLKQQQANLSALPPHSRLTANPSLQSSSAQHVVGGQHMLPSLAAGHHPPSQFGGSGAPHQHMSGMGTSRYLPMQQSNPGVLQQQQQQPAPGYYYPANTVKQMMEMGSNGASAVPQSSHHSNLQQQQQQQQPHYDEAQYEVQ